MRSITSNGSVINAARRSTKLPPKWATIVTIPSGQVYQKFSSDEKLRTCKNCGTVVPVAEVEMLVPIVQTVPAVQTVSEPDRNISLALGVLRITMVESFRGLRKFCRFQIAESIGKYHVTTKRTKDTKDSEIITFQFLTSCSSRPSW